MGDDSHVSYLAVLSTPDFTNESKRSMANLFEDIVLGFHHFQVEVWYEGRWEVGMVE